MHDAIPNLPSNSNGIGLVLNLDISKNQGTHWVGLYKKGKQAFYYDSYGVMPDDRTIKALKNKGDVLKYNTSMHQQLNSKRCGWFVLKWLQSMFENSSFYDSLYSNLDQVPSRSNERTVQV